jgi:hypothetical protein
MDMMVLEEEGHEEVKLMQGVITQPRLRIKAALGKCLTGLKALSALSHW